MTLVTIGFATPSNDGTSTPPSLPGASICKDLGVRARDIDSMWALLEGRSAV
jgi:hypothetical protein